MGKAGIATIGIPVLVLLSVGASPVNGAEASSNVVGGLYRPDVQYPEFMPLWREGWSWKDENGEKVRYAYEGMPLGGYAYAYFRNTGNEPLAVNDVSLNGSSLAKGVAWEGEVKSPGLDIAPASLQFSKLPKAEIERLIEAGEPVWWKTEPTTVPPGGLVEVTIRLRRDPKVDTLQIGIPSLGDGKSSATVKTAVRHPQFFSIGFSPKLDKVFAYVRHPSGKGVAPTRVLIDDSDVTNRCRIMADTAVDTAVIVADLERPLEESRYYVFQARYDDGSQALACVGAWYLDMVYGMWGNRNKGNTPEERAREFMSDMAMHNINVHMLHSSGPAHEYMYSDAGMAMLRSFGMRKMLDWVTPQWDPIFYFLTDEPDAADFTSTMLDPYKRIGSRAQYLVERCKLFRRKDPKRTPLLLNIDNTFKPENWYTYAQLPDIPCADPYHQEAVQSVLSSDPTNMAAYVKPTYVYAVGTIYQSAGAPNPMHLILHTCRFDFKPEEFPYRAPTPEEKRTEVYYSIAAGAKQISFWWYSLDSRYYGVGGDAPEMVRLWDEIGLVGAEMRTAGPLITRGCPAVVPVKAPRLLWVRSLLSGPDTMILLVVNDNQFSDRLGTVVKPVEGARLSVAAPSWLKARDVFQIAYQGTADVAWKAADAELAIDLGTVNLTRMIVITGDTSLRAGLQHDYETGFAENVRKILARPK